MPRDTELASNTNSARLREVFAFDSPLSSCSLAQPSIVISRIEFIDLIFRKQITNGAIQIFREMAADKDFETCLSDSQQITTDKAVFLLQ